jgi:methyl coenzyme M reductase subunit D
MEGTDQKPIVIEFSKTDLILLMQILNKFQKKSHTGTDYHRHLPRIINKIDGKLIEMIKKKTNV